MEEISISQIIERIEAEQFESEWLEKVLTCIEEEKITPDELFDVYRALRKESSKDAMKLRERIEEIVGKYYLIYYDLNLSEACAVGLLNRKLAEIDRSSRSPSIDGDLIETKNQEVYKLEIMWVGNTIPSKFLSLFANLKRLKLYICELTDYYPLTKLYSLEISAFEVPRIKDFNELKGLETLHNLKELYIKKQELDEIKNLENLTNLRVLDLSNNHIVEIKGLETLKKLEKLDLWGNWLEEISNLESLTNLKYLNLGATGIMEIKGLEMLKNLEELDISENFIEEIKGLEDLTNLKKLDIHGGFDFMWDQFIDGVAEEVVYDSKGNILSSRTVPKELTEEDVARIEKQRKTLSRKPQKIQGLDSLINLEELDLSNNYIEEIEGLCNLRNLKVLRLDRNNLTEIKGLEDLEKLEFLSLSRNPINPTDMLERIDNPGYGVAHPQRFVEYCKKKERMNIKNN